jgi:hypothetical protein
MARGKKRKSTAKSFGDFKKAQNEKRLDRIISEGKKSYASQDRGQSGGLSSIPSSGKKDAFVQLQRQKFFGDRNIPEERVLRRTRQEGGIDQFKKSLIDQDRVLKDSKGNVVLNANTGEPVFLTDVPGGRSVSDVAQDLAFRFGPTPREVVGDIGYGLGQLAKAYGIPVISTAQRIGGGLKDLYDYFFTKPTVTTGGSSSITVKEEPIQTAPQFPYNFETVIKPKPLTNEILPSELTEEDFNNTYKFLDQRSRLDNLPFKAKPNVSNQNEFQTALADARADNVGINLIGQLQNLQNLAQQYNLDKIQFDPFNPNQIGYKDQFMFNNTPVNYNIGIGDQGIQGGIEFAFKKGGSVDKHSGLGYKLK